MFFEPYKYPKPNMLVQKGTKVRIHGLQSEAGQKLNGMDGIAVKFYPETDRWSVKVNLNDAMDDKPTTSSESECLADSCSKGKGDSKTCSIHITNLSLATGLPLSICVVTKSNPRWAHFSDNGEMLISAGTMEGGVPSICILDDPRTVNENRLLHQAAWMGLPVGFLEGFLQNIKVNSN